MRVAGVSDYLIGAAFLLAVLSACTAAGVLVVTRRLAHLRGLLRGLAIFLVATAAVWAVHMVPLVLGVLSRWTVAFAALLLLAVASRVPSRSRDGLLVETPAEDRDSWPLRLMALAGVAAVAVAAVVLLIGRSPAPPAVDAVANYLPQLARWMQTGSFWELTAYAAYLNHATYPQSGSMMLLAVTLPWSSTFATSYAGAPFLAATAVAVYALAREVGAPRSSSALAGTAVASLPAVATPALLHVMVDAPMLAWFATGALFLLRSARNGDEGELLLAGCALGLSFGTKWYGVTYVPVLCVAWLVARRRAGLPLLRQAGLLTASIALFGGVWLVRNWILVGNPVHPLRLAPFGIEIFPAPHDLIREYFGFTVSDYLLDARIWREHLVPAYAGAFGFLGPLLAVATAVAAWLAWARRGTAHTGAVAAVAGASLAIGVLYTVTPDTAYGPRGDPILAAANARYLVPALMGAAVLAGWLAGRGGRARPLVELLLLAAVLEVLWRWDAPVRLRDLLIAAAVVVTAASVVTIAPRRATGAVGALVLLAAGWGVWRADSWTDYGRIDPGIAELQGLAPGDSRVAIVGMWPGSISPVLAAYGRRLDNRVDYVGDFVEGILRPEPSRDAFQRRVRTGRYDVVVVGQGPDGQAGNPQELPWMRELGYEIRSNTTQFVVLSSP
jgi:hypothetical protein